MPVLEGYDQFEGRHWETGSVRNYYAHRGVTAPHTGEPYSEALLLGVSGGAVMGYFSFAYQGYDPHVALLTRNTFDPLETLLQRLGVPQTVRQTASPDRAAANLVDSLENGLPALVWADVFSLPYNATPDDQEMWIMMPIVVYGLDEAQDQAWIADRARVPLGITPGELAAARSRVKKNKHRLVTLDPPNPDRLRAAVRAGIEACLQLYDGQPPRGPGANFGFNAFERWAGLLTRPGAKQSWAKVFPPGRAMYAGLTSAFDSLVISGKGGVADRELYADFLEEAALILERPGLQDAAAGFRRSAESWESFVVALLPESVGPFKETRELMLRRHRLFLDEGRASLEERRSINARLAEIKEQVAADFPLDEAGVQALCGDLAERLLEIRDVERAAVSVLTSASA
jgi:hypothetical protein